MSESLIGVIENLGFLTFLFYALKKPIDKLMTVEPVKNSLLKKRKLWLLNPLVFIMSIVEFLYEMVLVFGILIVSVIFYKIIIEMLSSDLVTFNEIIKIFQNQFTEVIKKPFN